MIYTCSSAPRHRATRIRQFMLIMLLGLVGLITGCSDESDEAESSEQPATLITVEQARGERVRETETTVGRIQSRALPAVSAETSGRVLEIMRDVGDRVEKNETLLRLDDLNQRFAVRQAEGAVDRLEAVITNQQRTVGRQRELLERNSISRSQFDAAEAELESLQAQLRETRARLEEAELALEKTRVTSPMDGVVEQRMVSEGDFVGAGTPLFRIVGGELLRITLPYPERIAHRLEPGLTVMLQPGDSVSAPHETQISELRPTIGTASRSIDAIVNMPNPGGWRSGGSITGTVVLATREDAVTVPENSVVRRPAGQVVYIIEDEHAHERQVETGVRINGRVEIRSGLEAGETVAVSGAHFLSDGARVNISEEDSKDNGEDGDSGEDDDDAA